MRRATEASTLPDIGIGIIDTGFMGKAHAFSYRAVSGIFPVRLQPVLAAVADNDAAAATRAKRQLGFKRATCDWRDLVRDPEVEIVSITAPNVVHREMALAAIAAGKHVIAGSQLRPLPRRHAR